MKYFDIHGHVNFPVFDSDRNDVLLRASEQAVGMITVGTDFETSKSAVNLAKQTPGMWSTVGLHPVFCGESHNDPLETGISGHAPRPPQDFDHDNFKELAQSEKVVAIGECGLDYFHSLANDIDRQKTIFTEQINLANELKKPLMLHVRSGAKGQSAYYDAAQILKDYAKVQANFHFFAGSIDEARQLLDLGCTFSFTGVLTFSRDYDDLLKYLPADRIMSETDCPYVAPKPFRGKRNEPAYVIEVINTIAEIRREKVDKISQILLENAKKFFNLVL